MLRVSPPSRLCAGCRLDLLSIFRYGFSEVAPPTASSTRSRLVHYQSKARSLTLYPSRTSPQQIRTFLTGHKNFLNHQPHEDPKSNLDTQQHGKDGREGQGPTSDQMDAIEQLEALLGKPVDEATRAYYLNSQTDDTTRPNTNADQDSDYHDPSYGFVRDPTTDTIAILRDAGAKMEDVARQARLEYGDFLPKDLLTADEMRIYVRLFGEPAAEYEVEEEEDFETVDIDESSDPELLDTKGRSVLYDQSSSTPEMQSDTTTTPDTVSDMESQTQGLATYAPLGDPIDRAKEVALSLSGEVMEDDNLTFEEEEESDDPELTRSHPLTAIGKWGTSPSTIFLPREALVKTTEKILSNFSNKHIKAACEKIFGGVGLPDSALTPMSGQLKQQKPIPVDPFQHMVSDMEANAFLTAVVPPTFAAITSVLVETRKRLGSTWLNNVLAKEGGPRVLDAGAGGAGVLAWREIVRAHWDSIHSTDNLTEPPATRSVVVTGSNTMRSRASRLLEDTTFIPRLPDYVHSRDSPTLEDDRPAQRRKQYDVIIAPHTLFTLKEEYMRKQHVQNLWSLLSPEGGVLILIEKGIPKGFEAIAGARDLLLDRFIAAPADQPTQYSISPIEDDPLRKQETGMIIAPCTTHEKCPMYQSSGLGAGRRDFCSFQQRYIRPPYLQRVLEAKHRNHSDVDFSYISVMKGEDLRQRQISTWQHVQDPLSAPPRTLDEESISPQTESFITKIQAGYAESTTDVDPSSTDPPPDLQLLPRTVFPPLKRRGHVSIDLCTPWGKIERWTIPRSFGKQAYRDARKSRWGDLWALGAKTRIPRNLQLGRPENKEIKKMIRGNGRLGRNRDEKVRDLKAVEKERMEDKRLKELEERLRELDEMDGDEGEGEEGYELDFGRDEEDGNRVGQGRAKKGNRERK